MQNLNIEQLLDFLKEDPKDSFTLYALALEYDKLKDEQAGYYYSYLLEHFPSYLATYYHAGKYFELNDVERAMNIYNMGIELAAEQGKTKAQLELKNALQMLQDEMD